MTQPVVIDAGPALNFFSTHNERLLLSIIGGWVHAPETVADEVKRKSARDARFAAAPGVWSKLERADRLIVLPDDVTPELSRATQRITGIPLAQRKEEAQDLGEVMVVAHAAVMVEEGQSVTVLIDDGGGAALATAEIQRLNRLRKTQPGLGNLRLVNTYAILTAAIRRRVIPDKAELRRIYKDLADCDDGLVDIRQTDLLSGALWD